jgi:hypothetical protein
MWVGGLWPDYSNLVTFGIDNAVIAALIGCYDELVVIRYGSIFHINVRAPFLICYRMDHLFSLAGQDETYKKWFSKYSGEKSYLVSEIKKLNAGDQLRNNSMLKLLPALVNIPAIFKKAVILD